MLRYLTYEEPEHLILVPLDYSPKLRSTRSNQPLSPGS